MKKFYSIALAVAVALSASAERQQASSAPVKMRHHAVIEAPAKVGFKAPAKAAATAADIEAIKIWNYQGLLQGQSGLQTKSISISVASTGDATVALPNDFTLKAKFDAAAGTLTIPANQNLGEDKDGPIVFYLKDADQQGNLTDGASSKSASVGTFSDGSLVFPDLDIWAIGNPANEDAGWYVLSYQNVFGEAQDEPEDPDTDVYTTVGTGKFVENILYPAFMKGAENKTASDVEIQSNGAGKYKVINPLQVLYSALKINQESPEMIIDATNRENCQIALTSSGIGNDEDGVYAYFSESWYFANLAGADEKWDPALAIPMKVENGNVTITIPYRAMTIFTTITNEFYYGSAFTSTLTFKDANAGIQGVAVDNADAPAVYYNLQGVRVENPASGVVIRVQGGKATKMLVK